MVYLLFFADVPVGCSDRQCLIVGCHSSTILISERYWGDNIKNLKSMLKMIIREYYLN